MEVDREDSGKWDGASGVPFLKVDVAKPAQEEEFFSKPFWVLLEDKRKKYMCEVCYC